MTAKATIALTVAVRKQIDGIRSESQIRIRALRELRSIQTLHLSAALISKGVTPMRSTMLSLIFVVLCVMSAGLTYAGGFNEGDCSKAMFGHDEAWQTYNAGRLDLSVRTCVTSAGNNHVDIKNPYGRDLCITITNSNGQRWANWPLRARALQSWSTKGGSDVTWQIGAKEMVGGYCK